MRGALGWFESRPDARIVESLARGGDDGFFRAVDAAVDVRLVPFVDEPGDTVTDRILRSIDTIGGAFTPDEFDIVHAQDCISANAVGSCIRTIHHLDQFTTPILVECHEKAVITPYARICVSQAVADEVHAGWGFTPTVIPNGVDYARFAAAAADHPEPAAARSAWRRTLPSAFPRSASISMSTPMRRRRSSTRCSS